MTSPYLHTPVFCFLFFVFLFKNGKFDSIQKKKKKKFNKKKKKKKKNNYYYFITIIRNKFKHIQF